MASTSLDEFVREALNRGAKPDAIATELANAGWSKKEIDAALAGWTVASFGVAIPKPKSYVSAREAFLYLVMFSLLGLVAFNLGSLLFSLIDGAIADALDTSSDYYRHTRIRSALAALAVATPLLAAFGWYIAVQRRADPALQQSRVRKWLTYVTLTIAALVFVGDLIALVYNFLSGELSDRLLLKLIVVGVIAAGIFVFFVRDVEAAKPRSKFDAAPILAGLGAFAVAVTFVAGYLSIENPVAAREYRLDDARLETLKRVATAAQCAFTFTSQVPASYRAIETAFAEKRTQVFGDCVLVRYTQQDEAVVTYRADDADHIELCTDFLRPTREAPADGSVAPFGVATFPEFEAKRAAAGRHCYRVRLVNSGSPAPLPEPAPPSAPAAPEPATPPTALPR